MIIGIEGPNFAGKSTMAKSLCNLFLERGFSCTLIPEYCDLLGDENLQPERPFNSEEDMKKSAEFYIALENKIQDIILKCKDEVIIRDRTFYTCRAYSIIGGNGFEINEYKYYTEERACDIIIFLEIDPDSHEYNRRRTERMSSNNKIRGLNYKINDYSYIYTPTQYTNFFKDTVSKRCKILFFDTLIITPERIFNAINQTRGNMAWVCLQ